MVFPRFGRRKDVSSETTEPSTPPEAFPASPMTNGAMPAGSDGTGTRRPRRRRPRRTEGYAGTGEKKMTGTPDAGSAAPAPEGEGEGAGTTRSRRRRRTSAEMQADRSERSEQIERAARERVGYVEPPDSYIDVNKRPPLAAPAPLAAAEEGVEPTHTRRRRRTRAKSAEETAATPAPAIAPVVEPAKPVRTRRTTTGAVTRTTRPAAVPAPIQSSGSGMDVALAQRSTSLAKIGIFVDVPNIMYAAERSRVVVDFGQLLTYLVGDRELVRASAYAPISDDPTLRLETQRFVQPFMAHGYRIVTKPLKRFADGSVKANFDVELAIDILTMSERLDVVCIVSGDGDFSRVVDLIASRGVRVEVAAFAHSTAAELRTVADRFTDLAEYVKSYQK